MIAIENKKTQMDDLLDKMAEVVQLDKTRYERMKQHYEAIKDWIEADEEFFKPFKYDLYPHGSVRIQTTVKPIGKDEFDLDIALHLKTSWVLHTPHKIYKELKRRLEENEKYKSMLEPKNRCIRLNYSGDFHIDILPGIQESELERDKLRVPDRELGNWVSSNPKGYAKWFLDKANLVKESLLEKALRAEKLPVNDFENKKPLQRAVQLIKRFRDIYFQNDDTYKTSSIVLTTIAGQIYSGEDSIFDTIDNIIMTIQGQILKTPKMERIKIFNPVNDHEDFTDKWQREPEHYIAFKEYCAHLNSQWQNLKKNQGVLNESQVLRGLFGGDLFLKAQTEQANMLESLRKDSSLGVNRGTGIIGSLSTGISAPIKPNTFHGDQ